MKVAGEEKSAHFSYYSFECKNVLWRDIEPFLHCYGILNALMTLISLLEVGEAN